MNDTGSSEPFDPTQPPDEHPLTAAPNADLPSARYRATVRLIGFRQVDEARAKPKRWWPWKRK